MVYKGNARDDEDEDEDDDASLPPLLKHLPKDFGGGASIDYFDDEEDENGGDFGTMIIKPDRNRTTRGSRDFKRGSIDDDGDGDGFSTFVVRSSSERESISGTVLRRTSSGAGSTMSRAVASMQASSELGFGKQRRGSGSSQGEEYRQTTKMSSSSIPDSVTREDPTVKYELLNELGGFLYFNFNVFQLLLHFFLNGILLRAVFFLSFYFLWYWECQGRGLMARFIKLGI